MGHKAGETLRMSVPAGTIEMKIVSVT